MQCVLNAKGRFYAADIDIGGLLNSLYHIRIAVYCGDGRDTGSFFCRGAGGKKYGYKSDDDAGQNPGHADAEYGHFSKIHGTQVTECAAQSPDGGHSQKDAYGNGGLAPVQSLQAYKAPDLLWRSAQTAEQPEEFCPLCNIAVHAAGYHKDSGCQNQKKQDTGSQI